MAQRLQISEREALAAIEAAKKHPSRTEALAELRLQFAEAHHSWFRDERVILALAAFKANSQRSSKVLRSILRDRLLSIAIADRGQVIAEVSHDGSIVYVDFDEFDDHNRSAIVGSDTRGKVQFANPIDAAKVLLADLSESETDDTFTHDAEDFELYGEDEDHE
jgi:hypothetical protein